MRKGIVGLLLLLTACAPGAVAPTVIPTAMPATVTSAPPTAVPATATVEPSATAEAPTATALPPTVAATAAPFFTQLGEIVPEGAPGEWDGRYTDPGAVVYYDGAFHMLRNGFQGWPAVVDIGYVTSTDGTTWTEPSEAPVLHSADVPYAGLAALASSLLVEPDGTWVLYFYTWESTANPTHSSIGRATASAPEGPWMVDPEPVLTPGPAGAWDGQQVFAPDVQRTNDGYMMYYSGSSGRGKQAIGRATSPDGVQWTKYDDPATGDALYGASDPVLTAGAEGQWDAGWVHQPRVFQTEAGWVMLYRAVPDTTGRRMALGYATSADGVQWERSAANPVLQVKDLSGARAFWFTNAVYHDGTLYLFWEVDHSTTSIYLATHTGPF